ncbi:MarR family transcriptional regulator [soil metagenome]
MNAKKKFDRNTALMQFAAILPAVQRGYRAAADKALAPLGLSQSAAWPLITISRMGESVRQGVLADVLGIEGPSLARTVEQLCVAGLATRRDDPDDRRARTLHLTDAGRLAADRIEATLDEVRSTLFKDVDDADVETCLRVFGLLGNRIGGSMPAIAPRRMRAAEHEEPS